LHEGCVVSSARRPYLRQLASAFDIADRLGLRRLDVRSKQRALAAA
jgi:hypothetical protein